MLSRVLPPKDYVRAGFYLALGVVVLAVLALAARRFLEATLAVATPFALGLTLALLLDPAAERLARRGLPRGAAAGLVFAVFLLLIVGLGWLTIPALIAQAGNLAQNAPGYVAGLQGTVNHFLHAHHKIGPVKMPANFDQLTQRLSGRVSGYLSEASGQVVTFLVGSATVAVQMVLTLIVAFYFLLDIGRLRARLFYLAPKPGAAG